MAQRVVEGTEALKEEGGRKRKRGKERGKKLCLTLNGFLIDLLRQTGRPLMVPELMQRVQLNIQSLRRSDGSNYKGDLYKIVIGVLSNCTAFKDTPQGWTIDQYNAQIYEESTLKNINRRLGKYRSSCVSGAKHLKVEGTKGDIQSRAQKLAEELKQVEDWLTKEDELLSGSFD